MEKAKKANRKGTFLFDRMRGNEYSARVFYMLTRQNMFLQKTRQKLRKKILFVAFVSFPILYYYLSPYLIIAGAHDGVVTGSFIIFILLFLSSLIFGRGFCGRVCPAGAEQEILGVLGKKTFRLTKLNTIKYTIWVPWILAISALFFLADGIKTVDFLYQTTYGISIGDWQSGVLFLVIASSIAIVTGIIGKRGFCHTLCWMAPFMVIGRKISNFLGLKALRLTSNRVNCFSCGICNQNCPMNLPIKEMVLVENMESSECILCATCVDVCPNKVIQIGFSRPKKKG